VAVPEGDWLDSESFTDNTHLRVQSDVLRSRAFMHERYYDPITRFASATVLPPSLHR
jgi:hypothetical protein